MLVYITTTQKDLYKRDMLNVFCKAADDLISFSYNKDRVLEKLKKPEAVKTKKVLIVFAEYLKATTPKYKFHPIRYCTIESVIENKDNPSYTYHLKLTECIVYTHNENGNTALIDDFNREMGDAISEGVENIKLFFREITFSAQLSKTLEGKSIGEDGVWPELVRHLGKQATFEKCIFFRQTSSTNSIDFKETNPDLRAAIELKSDTIYNLSFLMIAGKGVKGSGIYPTIETSENINTQGPFISQDSNAISLKYVLITKGTTASQLHSSFTMKAKPAATDTDSSPLSPEINNYIIIRPKRLLSFLTVAFIVVGIISPNFAELIPKQKTFEFLSVFRVKSEMLVILVKLIASAFVGLGTFYAYRKLPKSE